jgi:hypothetical protein
MDKSEIIDQLRDMLNRKRTVLEQNENSCSGFDMEVILEVLQKDIIALEHAIICVDKAYLF